MEATQMQHKKDSARGQAQNGEGGIVKGLILLALPLLSFQRDVLQTVRTSLEANKDKHVKAVSKLLSLELHALMMLLDPTRKLRARFDEKLEKELNEELTKILEQLSNGLVTIVDVQEKILPHLIDVLKEAKNGKPPSAKGAH
jgi:hypothetical protein